MKPIWGIDLGGTKVEAVCLEKLDPEAIISRKRIPTEADQGYEHILDQISRVIDKVAEETQETPETIGIGTPGALDPHTKTMKNSNTTVLNGRPFKKDLEAKLGIPIHMSNDANCFALAETRMGVVKSEYPDAQVVFGIIMGTGVGGGVVVNGRVLQGKQGIAGEWGHNFLDESGGLCYCGKTGCVERFISGTGLQRYYCETSGVQKKLPHIVESYYKGDDPYSTQTIERLIKFFGIAVSVIVNMLDPDVIVVGGGVGNIDLLYSEGVKSVEKYVFNDTLRIPIVKPKLGDSAGVFGAAALTVHPNYEI